MGMKKPLVKPAKLETTGEMRKAFAGSAQMRAMSSAVQVWLRARFTRTTWKKSAASYARRSTSCEGGRGGGEGERGGGRGGSE